METVMAKVLREEELTELVKKVAEEVLDVDLSDATPQTPLRSLGMDSLDLLELVSALEDHLEVCIPDSQLKEVETVGGLIASLTELQMEPQAAQPAGDGSRPADAGGEERITDGSR
jgi:acyl carrier protein